MSCLDRNSGPSLIIFRSQSKAAGRARALHLVGKRIQLRAFCTHQTPILNSGQRLSAAGDKHPLHGLDARHPCHLGPSNESLLPGQAEQLGLLAFAEQITRVEVHLSDENGLKTGDDDVRCMIEARVEGRPPTAVTHRAGSVDEAVNGAAGKLTRLLGSTVDRLRDQRRGF